MANFILGVIPPIITNIFFQLCAIRAVIIYCTQPIIDFTTWENKTIFFGVRNNRL